MFIAIILHSLVNQPDNDKRMLQCKASVVTQMEITKFLYKTVFGNIDLNKPDEIQVETYVVSQGNRLVHILFNCLSKASFSIDYRRIPS